MKKILIQILVLTIFASFAYADEEGLIPRLWRKITSKGSTSQQQGREIPVMPVHAPESAVPTSDQVPQISITEMAEEIEETIKDEDEAASAVPEIEKRKSPEGKDIYVYVKDEKDILLKELDGQTLADILNKVRELDKNIRLERARDEMEMLKRPQEPPKRPITAPKYPPRAPERQP